MSACPWLANLDASKQQILELFDLEKITSAAKILRQLIDAGNAEIATTTDPATKQELEKALGELQQSPPFNTLEDEAAYAARVIDALESTDHEWLMSVQTQLVTVYYRSEADTPFLTLKLDGVLNSDLSSSVAPLAELDLYTQWLPQLAGIGLTHSGELARLGRCRRRGYMLFGLPWPMAQRIFFVSGYACNMLEEEGKICVCVKPHSPTDQDMAQVPSLGSGSVVGDIRWGGCLYEPISLTHTRVRMIFNVDAKLPFVPTTLINLVTKKLLCFAFHNMQKLVDHLPAAYHDKISNNPALYEFTTRLAAEYYEKHGHKLVAASDVPD
eukprot:c14741_g1_i3.p1 GENE.c14741_g1_i3~~c14741_g1_i3.p1  ORF type:complete len:327 (+),score=67.95 c14741_g1_i3:36-1016(+)